MKATPRQHFTIYKLTGWDTRNSEMTNGQASFVIHNSIAKKFSKVVPVLSNTPGTINRQNRTFDSTSKSTTKRTTKSQSDIWKELHDKAHEAGLKAVKDCTPVPMTVGSPTTVLGNDIDYSKKTYFVEGGVCGFAWIKIAEGRSSFAKWAKTNLRAHKSYSGGVDIWVGDFGQSMQRKEAYAYAYADVLQDAGVKAYGQSRMD